MSRTEITDTIHKYFWLVDHGRASKAIDLFTETASMTFGPGSARPGTISGPDLRKALTAQDSLVGTVMRHVVSNILFTGESGAQVTLSALLTLYKGSGDSRDTRPEFVADLEDSFVLKDRWLIDRRVVTPIFVKSS